MAKRRKRRKKRERRKEKRKERRKQTNNFSTQQGELRQPPQSETQSRVKKEEEEGERGERDIVDIRDLKQALGKVEAVVKGVDERSGAEQNEEIIDAELQRLIKQFLEDPKIKEGLEDLKAILEEKDEEDFRKFFSKIETSLREKGEAVLGFLQNEDQEEITFVITGITVQNSKVIIKAHLELNIETSELYKAKSDLAPLLGEIVTGLNNKPNLLEKYLDCSMVINRKDKQVDTAPQQLGQEGPKRPEDQQASKTKTGQEGKRAISLATLKRALAESQDKGFQHNEQESQVLKIGEFIKVKIRYGKNIQGTQSWLAEPIDVNIGGRRIIVDRKSIPDNWRPIQEVYTIQIIESPPNFNNLYLARIVRTPEEILLDQFREEEKVTGKEEISRQRRLDRALSKNFEAGFGFEQDNTTGRIRMDSPIKIMVSDRSLTQAFKSAGQEADQILEGLEQAESPDKLGKLEQELNNKITNLKESIARRRQDYINGKSKEQLNKIVLDLRKDLVRLMELQSLQEQWQNRHIDAAYELTWMLMSKADSARLSKILPARFRSEVEFRNQLASIIRRSWNVVAAEGVFDRQGRLKGDKLDSRCVRALLKLAGIKVKHSVLIPPGESRDKHIMLDTGGRDGVVFEGDFMQRTKDEPRPSWKAWFDHHGLTSGRDTSTTRLMFNILKELGVLAPGEKGTLKGVRGALVKRKILTEEEAKDLDDPLGLIERAVDFVTRMDNLDHPIFRDPDRFHRSYCTLAGLSRFLQFEDILDYFYRYKGADGSERLTDKELQRYPLTKTTAKGKSIPRLLQRSKIRQEMIRTSKEQLADLIESGFVVETKYGSMVIIIKGKKFLKGGLETAIGLGNKGYLLWNPEDNNFFLSFPDQDISDLALPQGVLINGNRYIKMRGAEPLTFTLSQLLEKLGINAEKIKGELKEYIQTEEAQYKKRTEYAEETRESKPEEQEEDRLPEEFKKVLRKLYEQVRSYYPKGGDKFWEIVDGILRKKIPDSKLRKRAREFLEELEKSPK